ncbi:glycosyltransferase [Gluconobacter sp. LMG 1744]|uniref:glycosyltransferase family 4 protein n=1 Tax=Gluconobacter cadivus TaxID=2728101 RepID=UPI001884EEF0|nr:glycosyltransferase family 4 protein [Gluconobacter cadivus]MBF0891381.1 glycosyltransferase [Gluconobacter cadivus]
MNGKNLDGEGSLVVVRGFVDKIDKSTIVGWAYNGTDEAVAIRLLCNGVVLGIIKADLYREDLEHSGIGDGCHGFCFNVVGGLPSGELIQIEAREAVSGVELEGSPCQVEIPAEPRQVTALANLQEGKHAGILDTVERRCIAGWAWDESHPENSVGIQVIVNDCVLINSIANRFREDLKECGIGTGYHGFIIILPELLSPHICNTVRVIRDDGAELQGSPVIIEAVSIFDPDILWFMQLAAKRVGNNEERERISEILLSTLDILKTTANDEISGYDKHSIERQKALTSGFEDPSRKIKNRYKRALVIDSRFPNPSRDAGSNAIISHIRALSDMGYDVSFIALNETKATKEQKNFLEKDGIQILEAPLFDTVEVVLRNQRDSFSLIYLHRVEVAQAYIGLARCFQSRARIIFSVADLSYLRLERQAIELDDMELKSKAQRVRVLERICAIQADALITHSTEEMRILKELAPRTPVFVVPWVIETPPVIQRLQNRSGCLFVGHYAHQPNLDAAFWLIEEIMPLVHKRRPDIICYLVGSHMPERLRNTTSPGIEILGYVQDLNEVFSRVRIGVAPLRFGAGIKGKVLEMLGWGLPVVMTPVAAEGIPLPVELKEVVVEKDADSIANMIISMHDDRDIDSISRIGVSFIREKYCISSIINSMKKIE